LPRSGLPAEALAKAGGELENKKFLIIGIGALLLIVLVILFAVSSCNKKKTSNQTGSNTLTIWSLDDDKSSFDQIINDFQKSNNIKINYVKKDSKTYLNDALNDIAAGKGPDVWAIPNDWLPQYHDKLVAMPDGKLADSKTKKSDVEVYKDSFPTVVSQDNIIGDKIYGMPLSIDALSLYYNTDIFANVLSAYQRAHQDEDNSAIRRILNNGPKNWDEFVQAVKLITEKSGNDVSQSAVAMGAPDNVNQSVDILTLLMLQDGAKMTSDDLSTAQFHTKQNVFGGQDFPGTKALDFYASFANSQNENYTWNSSMPDALHAFAEGKTAMMLDYTGVQSQVKNINGQLQFQVIPLPQIKETQNPVNYVSYLTFTVTKASKNSDLAWNFITFLTNKDNSSIYRSNTRKPPALLASIQNASQDTVTQILTAQSWYKPDPEKADSIFQNMIKQVNEGKNSQTAIENAASQITTLLGKIQP